MTLSRPSSRHVGERCPRCSRSSYPTIRWHEDDTATCQCFWHHQRVWAGRSEHLAGRGDDVPHMEHRSAHAHRRRQAASRGLTGGDAESRRTCPASAGEDGDHVCRPRARPRPLGEPQYDPRGLRFTRTCTLTRTAAVSRWLRGTGTAPPDGGTSTPSPLGSGTVSYTPGPAPVVRGTSRSTGSLQYSRDVYT